MTRLRMFACAVGLALLATGCSHSPAGPAGPTGGPSSSASADAVFGKAGVQAAVKEVLAFTFGAGWSPHLISTHVDSVTAADFAPILPYLTPSTGVGFSKLVTKVTQHDKAAIRTLEGAVFFGVKGVNGSTPAAISGLVTDRKYTQLAIGVDTTTGQRRLSITFTASATIHLKGPAGQTYALPTSRQVRFLLVPATATAGGAPPHPFLISGWRNHTSAGKLTRT